MGTLCSSEDPEAKPTARTINWYPSNEISCQVLSRKLACARENSRIQEGIFTTENTKNKRTADGRRFTQMQPARRKKCHINQ